MSLPNLLWNLICTLRQSYTIVAVIGIGYRFLDSGNTVIVVEHNQQVVRAADWIVDLGPEGGKNGGQVVFTGTPLEILKNGETNSSTIVPS